MEIVHTAVRNAVQWFISLDERAQMTATTAVLVTVGMLGTWVAIYTSFTGAGLFILFLCTYHFLEFFTTAVFNPEGLSIDSFLINQSKEYGIAVSAAWLEYLVELVLFPSMKGSWVLYVGASIAVCGQAMRTIAMWTAGSNFTHIIQYNKRDAHVLVTNGIYSISRHPGYCGWFWWSVGTQILLCNPGCMVLYAMASYKFFSDRIETEEETLVDFFASYKDYRTRVGTGIPFIP
eukprot:CFRG1699T1